jgi:hypothetical protein
MAARQKHKPSRTFHPEPKAMRAAVLHGKKQARATLERRSAGLERRLEGTGAGLIVAEGDSWFDYPFFDVLEEVEDEFDFDVESVAHKGDTLEEMAYDTSQLSKLGSKFQKLSQGGRKPRAILLSGGGHDIAVDESSIFLNHPDSGLNPLNDRVVAGVLEFWDNELHPTEKGFTAVAKKFSEAIKPLPIPA